MKTKINLGRFTVLLCSFMVLFLDTNEAQVGQKELDIRAIRAMAGCYDVEFRYAETFSPDKSYEKSKNYITGAKEWVEIAEESGDTIVLQHILIVQDTMLIKHWRQDWIYQSIHNYKYDRGRSWIYTPVPKEMVVGKWTQNVYQVDDSPRYSGTATWTHVDGISSWYHKADSPLPRREYTKRSDYNLMKRGNRIHIHPDKWIHEQDNDKVVRTDSLDTLIAQEKGYNTYTKIANSECELAQNYWIKHRKMWQDVRLVWQGIFDKNQDLHLHKKVNDKMLYHHLFHNDHTWNRQSLDTLIKTYIHSNHTSIDE